MWRLVYFKKCSLVLLTSVLLAVVLSFVKFGLFAGAWGALGATSDCLQPLFAGAWYEKDPEKLRASLIRLFASASRRHPITPAAESIRPLVFGLRQLKSNLSSTETVSSLVASAIPSGASSKVSSGRVIAAIVPHASYQYSGPTAAAFYDQMRGQKVARVFILGPAHREHFHGCALPTQKYLCSPLGRLPVDTAVVQRLKSCSLFSAPYDSIRKEHSIEMQLPLIQLSFGVVSIVPIEVGQLQDIAEVRAVAKALNKLIRPHDLILVSSDFTHYGPRYKFEPFNKDADEKINKDFVRDIQKLDTQAFERIRKLQSSELLKFQKETHDTICGLYPVAILLAMLPSKSEAILLDYENSSSVNRAPDGNMVSYLAIVFNERKVGRRH